LQEWQEEELLKGDSNGDLFPDRSITRAEFVTLVNRVFNYPFSSQRMFVDVPQHKWYAAEFAKAYEMGIVKGDDAGHMKPEQPIKRAEAAVILAGAFGLQPSADAYAGFADGKQIAAWAQAAVSALKESGYVKGRTGNVFAPEAFITRAESTVMINILWASC